MVCVECFCSILECFLSGLVRFSVFWLGLCWFLSVFECFLSVFEWFVLSVL